MPIQVLSPSVINKIAAGEVIERPASVVKELMENSVDAGATRIDVTVEQGGLELVRVSDNGCGISADELPLAVASHATSKIREADDLFRVGTLGFRGEALASIAEISRTVLRSRTAESSAGAELEVSGGVAGAMVPCGASPGTTIEVHNLFFNTPVRRKFLRSVQTEMGHVSEAFTRLALAYPQVHCTLRHGGRTLHDLAPTGDWSARIAAFFGDELAAALIPVASTDGPVRLEGFAADPSQSRANPRMQYLFLNGRAIRDRALQHALAEAYRGLLLTGRYPVALLRIEMPAEMVDVNVHPTKLEVRFQDGGKLYSQLLGTLRSKFLTTDLTARLSAPPADSSGEPHDAQRAVELRREIVDWAKGRLQEAGALSTASPAWESEGAGVQARLDLAAEPPIHPPLDFTRLGRSWAPVGGASYAPAPAAERAPRLANSPAGPRFDDPTARIAASPVPAMQVHNRYLIAESEEGVVVIDQHALHERILYEQLRERVLAGTAESQSLLVPEPVDLAPPEAAAVLDAREVLARLGIAVEPFGGGTVLVSSYPAMLANFSPAQVLRDVCERLLETGGASPGPERRDLLDSLLHMIACKAAIKAGDRLAPEEVSALVEQRHLAQDAHHCPHGRPTALVFTREDLDRQFMRT